MQKMYSTLTLCLMHMSLIASCFAMPGVAPGATAQSPMLGSNTVQPTTNPAMPSITPQTATSQHQHVADIEAINKQLETLNASKKTLKQLLSKFDTAIEQSKNLALQARKKSMNILNQTSPEEAKKTSLEIQQNLDAINKIQQSLQPDIMTPFQTASTALQTGMQTVQLAITRLQTNGVTFQTTQSSALPAKKLEQPSSNAFSAWLMPEQKTDDKKEPAKTFVHYILGRLADCITGLIRFVVLTFNTIKNAIVGKKATLPTPAPQQTIPPSLPTAPSMPTTTSAHTNNAAEITSAALVNGELLHRIERTEHTLIQNEAQYVSLWHDAEKLEREADALQMTLASNTMMQEKLSNLDQAITYNMYQPSWRKSAEQAFCSLLDGVIFTYNTIYYYTIKLYRTYLTPLIHKISYDVQEQIKKEHAK